MSMTPDCNSPVPESTIARTRVLAGLVSGASIRTAEGWLDAGHLSVGKELVARGGARRRITRIERLDYLDGIWDIWPDGLVLVPEGVLGNPAAMYLLPDQVVVIDLRATELLSEATDCPVRAADLVGHAGIVRTMPIDQIAIYSLRLDVGDVICADGVMLVCPAENGETGEGPRVPLRPRAAKRMLSHLFGRTGGEAADRSAASKRKIATAA